MKEWGELKGRVRGASDAGCLKAMGRGQVEGRQALPSRCTTAQGH